MKKSKNNPVAAFNNIDYLHSREGRVIRVLSEFLYPRTKFMEQGIQDTIVFFGSARLQSPRDAKQALKKLEASKKAARRQIQLARNMVEMSRYYDEAVELSKRISLWAKSRAQTFAICSGGGPGIMEAANKGAKLAHSPSIGLNITLPFEQNPNPYISQELNFEFHYFFLRKFWFLYLAKALIAFPGGYGTLDELMEVLTLVQTKKVEKNLSIVLYGKSFWNNVINFDHLVDTGMISPEDLKLFRFCDSVEEAYTYIVSSLEKLILKRKPKPGKQFMYPMMNM